MPWWSNTLMKQHPLDATPWWRNALMMKQHHSWWSNLLMKQRYNEAELWWSIALMKQHPDEATSWWSNALMKQRLDEAMAWWSNVLMKQRPDKEMHWWSNTLMNQENLTKVRLTRKKRKSAHAQSINFWTNLNLYIICCSINLPNACSHLRILCQLCVQKRSLMFLLE